MRNVMKATTLESRFPLLAVEHGCIISKDADITAAFEVELPEVYTVTAEEYEGIHATWCKAIKVLPDYSMLHKQDWRNTAPTGRRRARASWHGATGCTSTSVPSSITGATCS